MGDSPSPAILRVQLGHALRKLASDARKSPAEVADWVGVSPSTISKIYNGRQLVKIAQVRSILQLCACPDDQANDLLDLAKRAAVPGWWSEYDPPEWFRTLLGREAAADAIDTYEMEFVPGLFQIPEYTAAVTRRARPEATEDEIRQAVEFRQARQRHLTGDGRTPRQRIILNEAILWRPIGGKAAWVKQVQHLIDRADDPTCTIVVFPFSAGEHPVMGSSFKLLHFEGEPSLNTVYLENDRAGRLLTSTAEVRRYTAVFEEMFHESATPSMSRELLVKVALHV